MLPERPGWWLLTLAASLFAAFFSLMGVLGAQRNLELARQHYAEHAARQHETPVQADAGSVATAMLKSLPSHRTLPQSLSAIFAMAREMDVILDMGDYRYIRNHGEAFGRYQVELPVISDYPTVRALVARLMNDMPYVALDDISFTREAADSEVVEARIRLTIFLAEQ
jgi:hypothetical protein